MKTGCEASRRKERKHKKRYFSSVSDKDEGVVRAQVLYTYVCTTYYTTTTTTDGVFSVLGGRRRSGCEALEDSDHSSLKPWALWFFPHYT